MDRWQRETFEMMAESKSVSTSGPENASSSVHTVEKHSMQTSFDRQNGIVVRVLTGYGRRKMGNKTDK